MMGRVNERLAMLGLALLAALAVAVAPWAAVNRETGARSAVVLLPNRVVDFTGRTGDVNLPAQRTILILTLVGLAGVAGGALVGGKPRRAIWLASGFLLMFGTVWGLDRLGEGVADARRAAFLGEVQRALDNPRPNIDVE